MELHLHLLQPILPILFLGLSLLGVSFVFISLFQKIRKTTTQQNQQLNVDDDSDTTQKALSILECSLSKIVDRTHETHQSNSLLLEILPPNSPKLDSVSDGSSEFGDNKSVEDCGKKKRKKRAKKKRTGLQSENGEEERERSVEREEMGLKEKEELVCLYPFTNSSSATQRKIKQQYDLLVKSHESNALTLAQGPDMDNGDPILIKSNVKLQQRNDLNYKQTPSSKCPMELYARNKNLVGQFANCLIEARNELQHKSEVIQRKFTITKALLFKANRASFERLHQQIYKLEMEQKRLEEDAFVYNWLQQQLKISPAYKKMLEITTSMDLKDKPVELTEGAETESEFSDISFEELLAQEKKDSFWQRNGKPKPCSG
ncbi:hypothetical protein RJ641_019882 [Dillenia turbinata]|uniref:Uncharacterized protein n=1 Tax=Dillenia turbinata TaxID=194707 RepID=A0AAN8UFU6_9MAGN